MAGRIPEEMIDVIRSQADIVDLISDFLTLNKRGKNYVGLCPFHNEKTPSFNVNPERQQTIANRPIFLSQVALGISKARNAKHLR